MSFHELRDNFFSYDFFFIFTNSPTISFIFIKIHERKIPLALMPTGGNDEAAKLESQLRGGEGGDKTNLVKIRTSLKELSNFFSQGGGLTKPVRYIHVP